MKNVINGMIDCGDRRVNQSTLHLPAIAQAAGGA